MDFVPVNISDKNSDSRCRVFLPSPERFGDGGFVPKEEFSEVKIDGKARKLSSKVLSMMVEFGISQNDRDRRDRLQHDCGVFALACSMGKSFKGERFGSVFGNSVKVCLDDEFEKIDGPQTQDIISSPGDVIYTTNVLPSSEDWSTSNVDGDHHFMVRASAEDGEKPIYLSKLGLVGPVVAHRLSDVIDFYRPKVMSRVNKLTLDEPLLSGLGFVKDFFAFLNRK